MILHPNLERAVAGLVGVHGDDPGPSGHIAAILADLIGDLGATEKEAFAELLPAQRVDALLESVSGIEARLRALELAFTETNRRIPAAEEKPRVPLRVFNIPVRLVGATTESDVRLAISALPPGLSAEEVVDQLQDDGILRRVRS